MKKLQAISKFITPALIFVIVFTSVVSVRPERSSAQVGAATCFTVIPNPITVPVQDYSSDAMRNIECIWNGLAWTIAKLTLQQITASTVNWINSGFEGSPSFITDPGSFFADTADQLTGSFISSTGALSQLCSPFSVDIRLALAFQGRGSTRQRYACTLSSIIDNVKNANVSVNGEVIVNGTTAASGSVNAGGGAASIDGFLGGDFSQGGWPAFMALTTEPQNNIYGAYFKAKSDLERQIQNRQNNIRLDLQMGRGFLSWKKCKKTEIHDTTGNFEPNTGQDYFSGADYSVKQISENGKNYIQDCSTETPGSVIAGSIDKALGIPQDQLNIADSINEIVGALFSQLVNKVLTGGLHKASSQGTGNYTASVTNQLLQANQLEQIQPIRQQLSQSVAGYESMANQNVSARQQAVVEISGSRASFQVAKVCFENKLAANTGLTANLKAIINNQLSAINNAEAQLQIAMAKYQAKLDDANNRLTSTKKFINDINNAQTTNDLTNAGNTIGDTFTGGVSGNGTTNSTIITQNEVTLAQSDLDKAKDEAASFREEALDYERACAALIN